MKRHRFLVNIIWLILLFLIPIPLIASLVLNLNMDNRSIIGIVYGLFAYSWMLVAVWLSSRPSYIERLIGLPDMYFVHGVSTIFALILAFLHKNMLPSEGLAKLFGDIAFNLFLAIILYSLIFMAGWLTSYFTFLSKIKKGLERFFKHELSIWIHRLNLVAIVLVVFHVLTIEYISKNLLFMIIFLLYTIFSLGSYIYYVLKKRQKGILKHIQHLDKNIVELTIESVEMIRAKSGDFVFVRFPKVKNMQEYHPFSIASVEDYRFKLIIDQVGDFTKNLESELLNCEVEFSKGHGVLNGMVNNISKDEQLVLIGGGVGVVPFLSIIEKFKNKRIYLIYTVKKGKTIIYHEKIREWENQNKNFTAFLQNGRLNTQECDIHVPIGKNCYYIIAGPMQMNRFYETYLLKKGIKPDQIFYESFNF